MIRFTAKILQFKEMGEKTGWSYIEVPASHAEKLKPGNKKSFRVKGMLDDHAIRGMALLPMGGGNFIMALKSSLRKTIHKNKGATVRVELEVDNKPVLPPKELLECLSDEPSALEYFKSLPKSHQNYFGTWVRQAKGESTRAARIARVVNAMVKKQDFGTMIRSHQQDRRDRMDGGPGGPVL
jgi:hypothetical protein